MIKLKKINAPDILLSKEQEWTEILQKKLSNGETPTDAEKVRYRHPEIKAALVEETNGKCAYCESKLLHVIFGDVEHISPKSLSLSNLFRWENLTLACDKCNTYKSDKEDIVDPYTDEPDQMFDFFGPLIIPDPSVEKAILTERVLKLNRADLRERRTEKIKHLADQLIVLSNAKNDHLREVLSLDLTLNEMAADQEFAACARSFLNATLPKLMSTIAKRNK